MDSETRIERMRADGLISDAQAQQLRDGLARHDDSVIPLAKGRQRPQPSPWLVTGLVLSVVCVSLVWLGSGAPIADVQDVSETLNQTAELGHMNRSALTLFSIGALLVMPFAVVVWSYNGLVSKEEAVLASWAQTESNFQRRADLIPALVESVSRYLAHERKTLTDVTNVRASRLAPLEESIDSLSEGHSALAQALDSGRENLLEDDAALASLGQADSGLRRRIAAFLAISEDYPELRSADQFLELQAQIEGTENRINVARQRFNQAVAVYNGAIRRLPGALVASLANFRRKAYFEAEDGAAVSPASNFE